MEIQKNVLLRPYSTFKIGGVAQFFGLAKKQEDLIQGVKKALSEKWKFYILGGGSNVLLPSEGYNGLIIVNRTNELKIDETKVTVDSGYTFSLFIKNMLKENLGGLEKLFGIPGTIGGAIFQNAGAYGQEIGNFVEAVNVIDEQGEIRKLLAKDLKFGYRDSVFKKTKYVILSVEFNLIPVDKDAIKDRLKEMTAQRTSDKPYGKSAGSFFKNPSSLIKAGKLIDEAGLKGKRIGDALISPEHGNFIINVGNATSDDIIKLSGFIKEEIYKKNKIKLDEEIQILNY